MTEPFDWAGLMDELNRCHSYVQVATHLRTRIEAAFVPAWQHKATCIGYSLDVEEAIARAKAAEAEVRRLRDTPNHIWAEARDTEWDAGFNHAVALFRQALGDNHE